MVETTHLLEECFAGKVKVGNDYSGYLKRSGGKRSNINVNLTSNTVHHAP